MKYLIALAVLAFSAVAAAQTCDVSMSLSMLHKGGLALKDASDYKGLTVAQAADLNKRSASIVDVAAKAQDKRGDYTLVFSGTNTCGITMGTLNVDGLTHKDAARVWRQAFKIAEATIKASEAHVAKGGKGPWGRD